MCSDFLAEHTRVAAATATCWPRTAMVDSTFTLVPKVWPVHLEPLQSCLTCHHLQHRYEESKQFSQQRGIVCKVQTGVRVLAMRHMYA